jgi:hypothetical protein
MDWHENHGFSGFSTATTYPVSHQTPTQLMVFFGQKFLNLSLCENGIFPIIFAPEIWRPETGF